MKMSTDSPRNTLEETRDTTNHSALPASSGGPHARELLASAWRHRPLSGLRWQLTIIYSALIGILLIVFSIVAYFALASSASRGTVQLIILLSAILLIILGIIAVFFLTHMLLRPLRKLSDAAQAIALGDLQQRSRLLELLYYEDEVSKTAASLNEMVAQVEQAARSQSAGDARSRRLFSDASHQLRTPLTSLRGFTEVLLRSPNDDPETRQRVLKLMKTEAERMTRLVNDLLMLSRLDEGDTLQTQSIDLVDIALESVEQAKVLTTDKRRVSLHFATDERLIVRANADKLKQALHILLDNAIKYGRPAPDGWIRLRIDKQDNNALLQVIDNGKGIDARDMPYIFDRFYRGEYMPRYDTAASSTPPAGAGLGLSIAQAILLAHHGDITATSEPDTETVFTLRIPCQ